MSAPKNNQNAAKPEDEKATSFLYIRVSPREKSRWVRAARLAGKNLSEWVLEKLNGASGQ